MGARSNGIILDDLEWPLTRLSRSRYTYKSNISKTVRFMDKVTKRTRIIEWVTSVYNFVISLCGSWKISHRQSTEWNHFQWYWVTSDPDFKVTTFSNIEYFRNDTRKSHGYYRTSIGSRMRSIAWWHFQWVWRTPNSVFKVTAFLKSNISKTVRFRDKVTKKH